MKKSLVIGTAAAVLAMVAIASGASAQETTLSGRMYADFTNIDKTVDGVEADPSGTGFDIKRLYIGIDHSFNDMFSANVTTDFQYSSAISSTEIYLKKAYVQAKFSDALVVRVGATDLPWVPYAESIYGFRFVENTVADRTKFATSSDWGLHASGKLNRNFSYAVAAINGAGYKNPTRSKGMDFEGRLSAKFDQLNFAIGGYTGKLGQETAGVDTPNTATRFNALAAFVGNRGSVGVEYFSANDYSAALVKGPANVDDEADGVSLFGSYRLTPVYTVFARAEEVKPSKTLSPSKKDKYYNLGVNFTAFKGIQFAAVAKHNEITSTGHKTESNEVGIWTEVRY
jgi:hypothetical protein